MTDRIVRVAVGVPLHTLFDYRVPDGLDVVPGMRVRVPFGRGRAAAVVVAVDVVAACAPEKLKPLQAVLDTGPLFTASDLAFLHWVADYYHHPVGEVTVNALPVRLRRGETQLRPGEPTWALTPAGREIAADPPTRAPRQAEMLA